MLLVLCVKKKQQLKILDMGGPMVCDQSNRFGAVAGDSWSY